MQEGIRRIRLYKNGKDVVAGYIIYDIYMASEINQLLSYSEICREIGRRARHRRERVSLSRRELAVKSGVSVPTIARFENGGVATIGVMVKIAWALDAVDTLSSVFAIPKYRTMEEFLNSES